MLIDSISWISSETVNHLIGLWKIKWKLFKLSKMAFRFIHPVDRGVLRMIFMMGFLLIFTDKMKTKTCCISRCNISQNSLFQHKMDFKKVVISRHKSRIEKAIPETSFPIPSWHPAEFFHFDFFNNNRNVPPWTLTNFFVQIIVFFRVGKNFFNFDKISGKEGWSCEIVFKHFFNGKPMI